jgi:hypothetical protein
MKTQKRICEVCSKVVEIDGLRWIMQARKCEECGKAACASGKHTWSIGAMGPGVCEADCIYCYATSSGTSEPLLQLGFRPITDLDNDVP